ncbi:MAG: TonB-dependent receptor [Sphingomonadaceae bacterium]|nr:TonB-dependent receptor [Sphingomonadaceae bacterium]
MSYIRARRLAAPILLASCCAATPAYALSDDETEPPIVVTGRRADALEQPPATVESRDAERIRETTNVVNVEDGLRYLPSLLVRKRHIGDTQAPLATRTSGVGASARSLIYADGVLLSALIGNNNNFASPRWGMVSPGEIERIDVLYGPFSAAYPGNAIGAVVNLTTPVPERAEGSLSLGTSIQHFRQYGTSGTFPAVQAQASWGGRAGRFAWLVAADHVSSDSQPLVYVTVARPAGASAAGTPVAGAFADRNRAGAPIYVIGAGGFERQDRDNLKLKLAFDLNPRLRLTWRGGLFLNDTDARAETWLRSGSAPVYAGTVNIDGRAVTIPATAFSNNVYRLDERHWMQALTLEQSGGAFQWRAIASLYDFGRDRQRIPATALPSAASGGAGSIVRLDGTGWRTFDWVGRWHRGESAATDLSFGAHLDLYRLASDRFSTADWLRGPPGALVQSARGRTRTFALWLQDRWTLTPSLELTLGGRYEWWRAYDGHNLSLAPVLDVTQPELSRNAFSPKASLAWQPADGWRFTLSAARAYRFPTVSELYQAISTGPTLTVPDPNLRPERAFSAELAAERSFADGHVRLSLFSERIHDALISQSAPLVPGSTTLFSYVQNIAEVRTHGLELAFEWRNALIHGLELDGSFTLADPQVVSDPAFPAAQGKDIPQVPRRRATFVATYRAGERASFTVAARYASRSFGTIDNSDIVSHTYQGFDGYFVIDARITWRLTSHLEAALGAENIGNDHYFLFHPFPQRSLTAELAYRW